MDNFKTFNSAPYPGYTSAELIDAAFLSPFGAEMRAEVARREKVAAGDLSVATAGERLRILSKAAA
jgi:hypothetical protein